MARFSKSYKFTQKQVKRMVEEYNKEKIMECIFDPDIAEIMAELENGGKELSYLSTKSGISEDEIKNKLSYLIEFDFILEKNEDNKIIISANSEKLSKMVESNENFDGAVDGLTKMDSYLN